MLTDLKLRSAKPLSKNYKLYDELGLFLLVTPSNCKYWRLRFQLDNNSREMALGRYPETSLSAAREMRSVIRSKLRLGIDPLTERAEKADAEIARERERSDTFGKAVESFLASRRAQWSVSHLRDVERIFCKELLPSLGDKRISLISKNNIKEIVDRIVARQALSFVRDVLSYYGIVIRHYNSYSDDLAVDHSISLRAYLPKQPKEKHHAALPQDRFGEFFSRLRFSDAGPQIRIGLELLAHTLVRTTEMRGATWTEFDFDQAIWTIPAERMKNRIAHRVPITSRVCDLLNDLRRINGDQGLIFKNNRSNGKQISENTFLYAMYRLGYRGVATPHGFRSLGSGTLNEEGFHRDAIERQLAHVELNQVRAAYDHSDHWQARIKMMDWWSNHVMAAELKASEKSIQLAA